MNDKSCQMTNATTVRPPIVSIDILLLTFQFSFCILLAVCYIQDSSLQWRERINIVVFNLSFVL